MTRLLGALVAAAVLAAGVDAAPPQSLRVLFVGNSLTAKNDLPAHVGALPPGRGCG